MPNMIRLLITLCFFVNETMSNVSFKEKTNTDRLKYEFVIEKQAVMQKLSNHYDIDEQDPVQSKIYPPNWDALDKRPLPSWYDQAKIGIFVHWGVFSVPSFRSEWFWADWKLSKYNNCIEFMEKNYRPGFTYADFAPQFSAEFFNADEWADLFQNSGAK